LRDRESDLAADSNRLDSTKKDRTSVNEKVRLAQRARRNPEVIAEILLHEIDD